MPCLKKGILEYWNIGKLNGKSNRFNHHSIIPPFHHSKWIDYEN